jgi:hypothetical protein
MARIGQFSPRSGGVVYGVCFEPQRRDGREEKKEEGLTTDERR